jgi:endonuclease-3
MSASNRANLIGKLNTALKKHYKPLPAQPTRPLLEHVLYASLLEDAPAELADEGMAKCEQEFFDWNEVRVTTATELSQVLSRLPEPLKAARRLKSNLQAIFEEFYTFDLDHLKKENLGKAVTKFERMPGMTPFVLSYTIQHGLGGHSIPVDYSAMVIMLATEIASQPEAMAGKVPGLERAIPKSKGIEFSGLLHQAAVALNKSTKDKKARALLDAVSKGSSKRLDEWLASKKAAKKRAVKRKVAEKAAAEAAAQAMVEAAKNPPKKKKAAKKQPPAKKAPATKTPAPAAKVPAKKAPAKKPSAASKSAKSAAVANKSTKKAAASKSTTKKPTKKKTGTKKKTASKPASGKKSTKKKSASRKLTKRKPR